MGLTPDPVVSSLDLAIATTLAPHRTDFGDTNDDVYLGVGMTQMHGVVGQPTAAARIRHLVDQPGTTSLGEGRMLRYV